MDQTIYMFHQFAFDRRDISLDFSTEPLKTMGCDSPFQSDIVRGKTILIFADESFVRANERQ